MQMQVIESQARKAVRKQMELEFEKSLLLDSQLKAQQQERDKIIQEIRDLGAGFDGEIETMLQDLERRRNKQREALEHQQREEQERIAREQANPEENTAEKVPS